MKHHSELFLLLTLCTAVYSQTLSGRLEKNTVLDAASSPWRITADLTVPASVTLTVEAGAELLFAKDAHLYVEQGGRLRAEGTAEKRISFKGESATTRWRGVRFNSTLEDNLLRSVDFLYGDASSYVILIDRSRVTVDGCTWNSTNKTIIEVSHPSALIQNCIFPQVTEVEVIHGGSLEKQEYLILRNNTFHPTTGYNDIIDFTGCKRPGPILQLYDNLFLGGGDDALDLDGTDCHIEGNVFTGFHKGHTGSSTSNAVATGVNNGNTSDIVVVRNLFYDNDHAVLIKEGCTLIAENNTFFNHPLGVVNFSEWPDRTVPPGKSGRFEGNIFAKGDKPFENMTSQPGQPDPVITVNRSIIDAAYHHLGVGNLDVDPLFVDPPNDFRLQPGSPAVGAGPNGLNMGAYVPAGASISSEPPDSTRETRACLTVGGPGIVAYKFAVNDPDDPFAWSKERPLADYPTIELNNLPPGYTYRVFVAGKNDAGVWQNDPPYTASKPWTVLFPAGVVHAETPPSSAVLTAFPNPFNAETCISIMLPRDAQVSAEVFNLLGQKVETLAARRLSAGTHRLFFNGSHLNSGIYIVRLDGDFQAQKRIFLIK